MKRLAILTTALFMATTQPFTISVSEVVSPSAISGTAVTPTDTPTGTAVTPTKKKKTETFKITAYCPCRECSGIYGRQTATGNTARAGHTAAVDPTVIRYGTHIKINGIEYIAEDCGGAVKGNTIDIFFDTHEETEQFGVKYLEVEVMR